MKNEHSLVSRRTFVGGLGAACATGLHAAAPRQDQTDDRALIQKEIDAIKPDDFKAYIRNGTSLSDADCKKAYERWPVLRRYDDAFRNVVKAARATVVTGDTPAVWYVYNMGLIVKTREALFSMDLSHRLAPTFADELDFAIVSHSHSDHHTPEFYNAMNSRHKTVVSNFADNYGACFHKVQGGFSRGECTYKLKDVTVHTYQSDHNTFLRGFVMPAEVSTRSYTILNSGDTFNTQDLRPKRTPDMWVHHAYCWYDKEGLGETVRGVRAFRPRLAVVAHHQELAHAKGYSRWTFEQADLRKKQAEKEGVKAIVPFWGDRLV